MQSGGADVIELGVPFSDPVADGPVIQKSNAVSANNALRRPLILLQISLKNGTDYSTVLALMRAARDKGLVIPVLLMSAV